MKKINSIFVAILVVLSQLNTLAFSAYGGGSSVVSFGGGGGSFVSAPVSFLTKDTCLNGDYSSSQYDGTCGNAPVTKPSIVDQVITVIAPVLDRLLETGPKPTVMPKQIGDTVKNFGGKGGFDVPQEHQIPFKLPDTGVEE